jgi:hypothetical protein
LGARVECPIYDEGVAFRLPLPRLRTVLVVGVVGAAVVAGAMFVRHRHAGSGGTEVVNYSGVGDIKFGQTSVELTAKHGLASDPNGCVPRFGDAAHVDPVFVDDKLVLLWLEPPAHTPEGVRVGSPVTAVRKAYPKATDLAPPGPYRYAGIMATSGDKAYLFLYDGGVVRKEIVGYQSYAQELFTSGPNPC